MNARRAGTASVLELVLVCCLFALVLAATARFVAAQSRISALLADRFRAQEAVRTTTVILHAELRALASEDFRVAAESIGLRAARGSGAFRSVRDAEILVRYAGVRRPDPRKDSVLVVSAAGPTEAFALVDVAGSPAGDGLRLTLDRAPTARTGFVIVFEPGSYHLSGGAFRYRRGQGGRQPVTEALFDAPGFETRADGRLVIHLPLSLDSVPHLGRRGPVEHIVHNVNQ